jgi:hypothetical protein
MFIEGNGQTRVVFADMENADPFSNGWITFFDPGGSGTIAPNTADLPPMNGGSTSLETQWSSGGNFAYIGGFGKYLSTDISGMTRFNFWINPDEHPLYLIQVNLQEDVDGDGSFDGFGNDDEFQYDLYVSPSNREAVSSGGWQLISIPLSSFYDDNSVFNGGDGILDNKIIYVVFAIITSGPDISFRTDYWTFSNESYDIYSVNTKNGNVERVTFIDGADEYNPSFKNDGKLVAHDVVSSSDPFGQSIYITDVSTGVSTPLAGAEGGNDASWSPNGEMIAFDRNLNIYVVPASGGTSTLVRENAIDAEWSNNSNRLVFTDLEDFSLRTIDVKSGTETSLGVLGKGIHPSWSADGKYIAYSDDLNIFVIAVNQKGEPKGSPVQLTTDGSLGDGIFNQQPSWSNNGKTIVFHSTRETGDFDIWTVSSSGGTPALLAGRSDMGDYDPSYSKNGKYVAYAGFTFAGSSLPKAGLDNGKIISADKNSIPSQFELTQNYPNPFNPSTVISYAIPQASNVKIEVFNATGEKVATLVDGFKSEGNYEVKFDANGLPSGLYLYRISAGSFVTTKKMVLMK